jgi:cell division protein FtsN
MRDDIEDEAAPSADAAGDAGAPERDALAASAWLGAALAIAVMLGAGVWLYGLTTRNPAEVPVIAAAVGPAKTRPTGEEAAGSTPYLDMESYAADEPGAVEPGDLTLLAPPPRPTDEDRAMGDLAEMMEEGAESTAHSGEANAPAEPRAAPASGEGSPAAAETAAPPAGETATVQPSGPASAEGEAAGTGAGETGDTGTARAPAAAAPVPARPRGIAAALSGGRDAAVPARETPASSEADRAALAVAAERSRVQVQLGAYRSETRTRAVWDRLRGDHPGLLGNRALAVQTTESDGTVWYRLRVGPFATEADARALCEALTARGQPCLVATNG